MTESGTLGADQLGAFDQLPSAAVAHETGPGIDPGTGDHSTANSPVVPLKVPLAIPKTLPAASTAKAVELVHVPANGSIASKSMAELAVPAQTTASPPVGADAWPTCTVPF